MTRTLRSAIVGTGFMGDVHARAVRAAGGTVACVAGSSAERAEAAAGRFAAERAAASAADAITAADVDLVHICTPNASHRELAELAIAAGKHVICEKPLALSSGDTGALLAAADRAGIVHAVPFAYRFYSTVRTARARVAGGYAGAIRLLHGTYLQDWLRDDTASNWRVDPALGGRTRVFGDIGVHWCDLAEFVSGHCITRLDAQFLTAHPERGPREDRRRVDTEDCVTVTFRTDRGAIGTVVLSQVSTGHKNRLWLSVEGDAQSLVFDQENPETLWAGLHDRVELVPRAAGDPNRYDVVPVGHPQGYQECFTALVRDVHDAIGGAVPDGLPTFADGHRAAVLTDAVVRSATTGTSVDIGP
ncbi:MAG TPA: Gfo/Idh/MocA family oxidoreductase [Jatrophihabitans sp.]|jgi:predicted dehydrogenase|uniref:Gfo/Idh/MocA family protein n=1 Tax=Jatrophihabitans sp. TaxID=1932789 RepID=UPI002DFD5CD7|nr:Gfo/Idh/MocA family oxidoreductase [Jatrophihabitans sp.]